MVRSEANVSVQSNGHEMNTNMTLAGMRKFALLSPHLLDPIFSISFLNTNGQGSP
jgi:hypothetical protein